MSFIVFYFFCWVLIEYTVKPWKNIDIVIIIITEEIHIMGIELQIRVNWKHFIFNVIHSLLWKYKTLGFNPTSKEICTLRILDLEEIFWLYRVLLNTCTQVCFMVERPMLHYLYRRPYLYFDRMFEKFLSFCTWSHLICFCRDSLLIYFAFYVLREVLM